MTDKLVGFVESMSAFAPASRSRSSVTSVHSPKCSARVRDSRYVETGGIYTPPALRAPLGAPVIIPAGQAALVLRAPPVLLAAY